MHFVDLLYKIFLYNEFLNTFIALLFYKIGFMINLFIEVMNKFETGTLCKFLVSFKFAVIADLIEDIHVVNEADTGLQYDSIGAMRILPL